MGSPIKNSTDEKKTEKPSARSDSENASFGIGSPIVILIGIASVILLLPLIIKKFFSKSETEKPKEFPKPEPTPEPTPKEPTQTEIVSDLTELESVMEKFDNIEQ